MDNMRNEVLLSMQNIRKSFAGNPALTNANLEVAKGEVHALVGENGAGKSTILKILTGVYQHFSGEIIFDGREVKFTSTNDAQKNGISPIYQEINLVSQRTVAQNIFLGKEPTRHLLVDRRKMRDEANALLAKVGVTIDVDRALNTYSVAVQQMVAIARALSFDAKLLIMDEPTSSLHDREIDVLFSVIERLRESGVSVIFVSHKFDEIYRICDYITILRDGRTVTSAPIQNYKRIQLVADMLGKDPNEIRKRGQTAFNIQETKKEGDLILETANIRCLPKLKDVSISLKSGEVLGIAGLLGSGRSELAKAIYGALPSQSSSFRLLGSDHKPINPEKSIGSGIALVPEDRKGEGLIGVMSIKENLTLSSLKQISRFGLVSTAKENKIAETYIRLLRIKCMNMNQAVSELSGGNQQKVLLGRALALQPRILILDEPTRGVDVGAKAEIQSLISDSIREREGFATILISSEMEEILEGSNKIHVIKDGFSICDLDPTVVENSELMQYLASEVQD